jgi:hypothetical protein
VTAKGSGASLNEVYAERNAVVLALGDGHDHAEKHARLARLVHAGFESG